MCYQISLLICYLGLLTDCGQTVAEGGGEGGFHKADYMRSLHPNKVTF